MMECDLCGQDGHPQSYVMWQLLTFLSLNQPLLLAVQEDITLNSDVGLSTCM